MLGRRLIYRTADLAGRRPGNEKNYQRVSDKDLFDGYEISASDDHSIDETGIFNGPVRGGSICLQTGRWRVCYSNFLLKGLNMPGLGKFPKKPVRMLQFRKMDL